MEHKFTLDMPGKVRDETIKSCSICFVYMCAKKSYILSEKKRHKDHFLTGSTNIFGHFLQWAAGNIELMGSLMQVMDLSRLAAPQLGWMCFPSTKVLAWLVLWTGLAENRNFQRLSGMDCP